MTTAVKAVYQNGVFKPKEPLDLKDETEVEVLIPSGDMPDDDPTGWQAAERLIGFIEDAPSDMSERHDIREALAVDADFTHRFTARPGPKRR